MLGWLGLCDCWWGGGPKPGAGARFASSYPALSCLGKAVAHFRSASISIQLFLAFCLCIEFFTAHHSCVCCFHYFLWHLILLYFLGKVVKNNEIRSIHGEGMPHYKNPFTKGQLIIKFNVTFPEDNFLPANKLEVFCN